MYPLLSTLFRRSLRLAPRRPSRTARRARPRLEALESRLVPAAYLSYGELHVDGTSAADTATVNLTTVGGVSTYQVRLNGATSNFTASRVTGLLYFIGGDSGDYFANNTSLQTFAYCGAGNDTVYGGTGNDSVWGEAGADFLAGWTGQDYLYGGTERDSLYGESGDDNLYGSGGNDVLDGGSGTDRLYGEADHDSLLGGLGNDSIQAGDGNDTVRAGYGNDSVWGSSGNDSLFGEGDDDRLYGSLGNDTLDGGDGRDSLYGAADNDSLTGGAGNDSIDGYTGTDTVRAGAGNDSVWAGDGNDSVFGEADDDQLYGGYGDDSLDGGAGRDWAYGEADHDSLTGGIGDDILDGWDGNDTLKGEGDQDILYGGYGNDSLEGGDGNDELQGMADHDLLRGGIGHDNMYGDDGDDTLYGSAGDDSLYGGIGNDGLFGSTGANRLVGGEGADRFLIWAGSTAEDYDARDARVWFIDSAAKNNVMLAGQHGPEEADPSPFQFAAGTWAEAEIERLDVALGNLHRHTGNTRLLETVAGGEMTFERVGAQLNRFDFTAGGWNGGTTLSFTTAGLASNAQMWNTVYHEIGHNRDDAGENRHVTAFRAISDWRQGAAAPTANHVASLGTGDDWWHGSDLTLFARTYGQTNPNEDFATTFETYFMNTYHVNPLGNNVVQAKLDNLDLLFADLRLLS